MEAPDAIAERVGRELETRGETLAVAESATGGLVAGTLTAIPGASAYVDRGFVTYTYGAKTSTLGIDRAVIDRHGAVSEPVAARMATAARDLADTTWATSVTGIAGPDGGTDEKPVGTTAIGVAYAGPWGSESSWVETSTHTFAGDRSEIRTAMTVQALEALYTSLSAN